MRQSWWEAARRHPTSPPSLAWPPTRTGGPGSCRAAGDGHGATAGPKRRAAPPRYIAALSSGKQAVRVTAVSASAQFGGTERVLLDFATRAFEHDIALRVLTPRDGPLIEVLNEIGVPTQVVPAPKSLLRGSQQAGHLTAIPRALSGLVRWSTALTAHPFWAEADVFYTIAFKEHGATAVQRRHPVVWHLHQFPPPTTGALWRFLARQLPDAVIANSQATGRAWQMGAGAPPSVGPPLSVSPPRS